jgi:hypothetical protein
MSRAFEYFKLGCKLYSVLFCFAQTYLLLMPMFIFAYMSGTYQCIMDINSRGEATAEMIFFAVASPFIIYGIYLNMMDAVEYFLSKRLMKIKGDI